jgi:hypothetical protein
MSSRSRADSTAQPRIPLRTETVSSPSYSTTPVVKRSPAASRSFFNPRKSFATTVPESLTATPAIRRPGALKDNVDFGALLVPEMVELDPLLTPACLPPEFLDHPGLEQVAEQGPAK